MPLKDLAQVIRRKPVAESHVSSWGCIQQWQKEEAEHNEVVIHSGSGQMHEGKLLAKHFFL